MGRPRKTHLKLPPYVYKAKGRYIYKPWKDGKFSGERRLCSADAPLSEIWTAYEAAIDPYSDANSFDGLGRKYLMSDVFAKLAPRTQRDYQGYHRTICRTKLVGNRTLGTQLFSAFTPGVIRRYLDHRKSGVQGNREVAYMSAVFAWAYERDMVSMNPCRGVRRNKETPRDRYVEDWEYDLVHSLAHERIQIAMDLAYLCMARQGDILRLTKHDLRETGIYIRQGKTSVRQIKRWSPKLRAVINLAANLPSKISSMYVIHDKDGQPQNPSSFGDLWQAAMKKALRAGLQRRFTFHDIKAKGISDYQGDKGRASGHKSPSMVARYDRKPQEVDPTE